jgi:hypothetical protein
MIDALIDGQSDVLQRDARGDQSFGEPDPVDVGGFKMASRAPKTG